ncbi:MULTISPECIES: hypothetical protein [unclassified Dysgonomonas]|uniref:hypothetical protein n=1 Tax=unclassified Dysgonomonas TaxID=2630389 RepID=UPI0006818F46|nr:MULTISPECIES: hypothetical protein [unclassified Dysgonomonas]MBD8347919.1 hypothetical protein [Dysgonomonas sp. HGC4]MBF0575594.1 hypothetical protein [Dysgonomonas sp. GY617]
MTSKFLLLLLFHLLTIDISHAQVGINTTTPNASTALDIVSTTQGVLIPRMTSSQRLSISSPASGLLVYDTNLNGIYQNAGTAAAPSWVPLSAKDNQSSFFYMPSIAIDASTEGSFTVDLYTEYKNQFTGADQTTFFKSAGAPNTIPYFPSATDLYYYITYYDNQVIQINSISTDGKVSYTIVEEANYDSFMNVVFVTK